MATMSDKITLEHDLEEVLQDVLGEGEYKIIEKARNFLDLGMPGKMEDVKIFTFLTHANKHEADLAALRYAVGNAYNVKWHAKEEHGAEVWDDLKSEGYSISEVKPRMWSDKKYVDLSTSTEKYKLLLDYLEHLVWQLKGIIKLYE